MLPDWLPWLLQVNDSAFPSGAYAHSLGLEELVQAGVVATPADLETFLNRQILPSLLHFEIPFFAASHHAAARGDLMALLDIDVEWDAWKPSAEARAASRQLGSRRLALSRQLDPGTLCETYAALDAPCHHLVVSALELRILPVEAAACAFSQQTIAGYATAAMKLMRLGQEKCQGIIRRSMLAISVDLPSSCQTPCGRAGWFNPLLEIASMRHARAGERLFIS